MPNKICPLFVSSPNNGISAYCVEQECAWWSQYTEACAIVHIADVAVMMKEGR